MRALTAIMLAMPCCLCALDQVDMAIMAQWAMPILSRPDVKAGISTTFEDTAAVRDQDAELRRRGVVVGVAGRVRQGEHDEVWVRAVAIDVQLEGDARLPHTGALPERLQDLRVGGFWRRVESSGVIWGFDGEVSSPSDQPFAHARDLGAAATAFTRVPTSGQDGWLLMLRYDSTSTLLPGVPLPAAAYQIVRPGLMVSVGVPLLLTWRPLDDWVIAGSYFPIDAGRATLSWTPHTPKDAPPGRSGPWLVQSGVQVAYDNWFRAERREDDERLTFRTVRAFVAGEWRPFPGNSLRLAVGRMLINEIYEAESWSERASNRIRIDPAWYATLGAALAF